MADGNPAFRYIEHDELYTDALLAALRGAKRSLWIATANLKATLVEMGPSGKHIPIATPLAQLAARDVEIKLLHASKPSQPFMDTLETSGLTAHDSFQMRKCPRLHFKTIIVDGGSCYLGSANLTGAGLGSKSPNRRNFELGFLVHEPDVIERVTEYFETIWCGAFCCECGHKNNCDRPLDKF